MKKEKKLFTTKEALRQFLDTIENPAPRNDALKSAFKRNSDMVKKNEIKEFMDVKNLFPPLSILGSLSLVYSCG